MKSPVVIHGVFLFLERHKHDMGQPDWRPILSGG